jgi:hypothetical protein
MFSRFSRTLACAAIVGLGLVAGNVQAQDKPEEEKGLLDKALSGNDFTKGIGDAGISIGGYAQGSWTHNLTSPHNDVIVGRGFDFENDDLTLNGIGLTIHRDIEATGDKFDIGFGVDLLYGGDARFTHSNGLFDDNQHGDNQYDITQAYTTFAVPVGRGLLITAGKFVTPLGYEYVDPRKNTLYSHGYIFNFATPFSQTGVMGEYNVADNLKVSAGFTRGWDQSTEDNNSHIDFLGSAAYTPDKQWSYTLSLSTGPQQTSGEGWRTEVDFLATYQMNEQWSFGGEAIYGIEADVPGTGDDYSQWYGVAFYPSYKLNEMISLNARGEWFSDVDGTRGVGTPNVFEATVGCAILPLANTEYGKLLTIRPEIRYDYAPSDAIFDSGTDHDQVTFAVDAVLAF